VILLHHPESELSRTLLADLPGGAGVIDWTDAEAVAAYAGPAPSAFPGIVVDVPAYLQDIQDIGEDGTFQGMGRTEVSAHQEVLRLPASWAAVNEYAAFVASRAAANPVE